MLFDGNPAFRCYPSPEESHSPPRHLDRWNTWPQLRPPHGERCIVIIWNGFWYRRVIWTGFNFRNVRGWPTLASGEVKLWRIEGFQAPSTYA